MYVWERIGENTLSAILHSTWERGRVNLIFSPNLAGDVNKVMKHLPSPYVLCNPCYSWWCYGQILAISPQAMYVWERIGENTLSAILHSTWERGRVNLILSLNLAGDVNKVMKHFPSPCVLCNPCYSWWCYGQNLAIAPWAMYIWERIGENTLSTILHSTWERGRVNLIFSLNLAGDVNKVMKHFPSPCVLCNPCYSWWCYGQNLAIAPRAMYVWERIGENTLSAILHSTWERGRVNLILSLNLAGDVN